MVKQAKGFTLIELLVGLAISLGLITTIYAVLANFDQQGRRSLGISDLRNNLTFALDILEQRIANTGRGAVAMPNGIQGQAPAAVSNYSALGCLLTIFGGSAPPPLNPAMPRLQFAPFNAAQGNPAQGAAGSDRIDVMYGNASMEALPARIPVGTAGNTFQLTRYNLNVGDRVLVVQNTGASPPPCWLTTVRAVGLPVQPMPGAEYQATVTLADAIPFSAVDIYQVHNLGPSPAIFRIQHDPATNSLQMWNLLRPVVAGVNPAILADNIVDFQVQLGLDTQNTVTPTSPDQIADDIIDVWTNPINMQATVGNGAQLAWPTAGLQQVKAVRVGVRARRSIPERPPCGFSPNPLPALLPAVAAGAGGQAMPDSGIPVPMVGPGGSDPTCYRYEARSVVIPLRGMIWSEF
ncbi:PilW family protein [Parvibium lacunae]|uniref:Type II secretion system protein n=1 Tax=Parvibium lacunae TaxID=1888893 RepID=A0A368L1F3_9BURK|nr:type II secretion system protein [Parvibium lacunae]RCS57384.1 type II secretion system protein [Parvibium lacunae]